MKKDLKKKETINVILLIILTIFSLMNLYKICFSISNLIEISSSSEIISKQAYIYGGYNIIYNLTSIIILWASYFYLLTNKNKFKIISVTTLTISIILWIIQAFFFFLNTKEIFILDFISDFINQYFLLIISYLFATSTKKAHH